MKNNSIKTIILSLTLVLLLIFYSGCAKVAPDIPSNSDSNFSNNSIGPTSDWISIDREAETTKDCTPNLAVFSEGAAYMSFSGDGNSWTDWIPYQSSYGEFNIANGLYGTIFGSGGKDVYVHFKDSEGNIFPIDIIPFDSINYEMQELHFIKIIPQNVIISMGSSFDFTLHGYNLGGKNEVPLEGSMITWTKSCGVGKLNPIAGLSTSYTAPLISGIRNISAHYNNLGTGAVILIANED
jgi:hypothetical protein